MQKKVRRFMEQWNMAEPGASLLVGLSGGADSVCLCLVLQELAASMGYTVRAVHVEHGIRGEESLRDEAFVRAFCGEQGIALTVRHVCVPEYARAHRLGTEEAARILRYGIFAELAGAGCRVALAHHMEDNAETMLMALARGSGLDGLCAMPPVRRDGEICYIRPFLCVSRGEIEAFLEERGQKYCVDSTNGETKYTRNYVRSKILPEFAQVNPRAVAHMNQTASRLMELREYMEQETEAVYGQIVRAQAGGGIRLSAGELEKLPRALQGRVIYRALGEAAGAGRDLAAVHVEAVLALLKRQSGRQIKLPGNLLAYREYGDVVVSPAADGRKLSEIIVTPEQIAALAAGGGTLALPAGEEGGTLTLTAFPYGGKSEEISTKMYTKWFDCDMIKDGFSIRGRREGDFFRLGTGHRKKLSDYFVDEKIPAGQRDLVPLLAAGPEVLWLIGWRMGAGAMVTERTRTVLSATYEKGET
ncbi:MAG: tRNA lysidine(34) synthetase TilS [Muribaculaceae bacterium]|nr:tRNA lysidine(34) synthetase TilS [Muribaculaceae bacterium]MCM1491851.1 tRNA lysidine(34) synthetase TilS [Muribaculaceae bacterium]